MKLLQLLSRISIIGGFTLTILVIFFEKYFSPSTNRIIAYILAVFFVIFPIVEILKRKAIKKHENEHH